MTVSRWIKPGAALLALALLAGCEEDGRLSRNSRHYTPISPKMVALMAEKGTTKYSPILLRAYKQESELEVWKMNASGEYVHLKTYPMCRWSGQLGPKKVEGDRQVPEGFYTITEKSLNPNSAYYLSFNVGYPNAYDRAHGRTGSLIMVHGACSSMGCFSMTDEQIAEIYAVTREAFAGGQKGIQFQSFPFRFTPQNMAKFRADPNMPFWKMLKEGADTFELTKREPQVAICERKYAFDRPARGGASEACGPADTTSPVVQAVAEKARADEIKVAELVASGVGAVRRVYKDGDQHHVFKGVRYAASGEDGRYIAPVAGNVSRVAEVSRPDALEAGPVEIPVGQPRDRGQKPAKAASPVPGKAGTAVAASPAPVAPAQAYTSQPQGQSAVTGGLFRNWLGGSSESEKTESITAVEPATPQPSKVPLPPKAPERQAGVSPTVDKTVDARKATESSLLKGFNAYLPGLR